ncbi:MAG: methyltransferase domain-containing protein [Xanthomonadaceae bacterium]|nr:methyltransferase domain-containing protein [Rhodospirillaceae bacterium]NIA18036.1 methyltransferase domain-containing protein [Xanthomonadaceae bacterium]
MDKQTVEKIIALNKNSYEEIAEHFSITRNYIWKDLKNLVEYMYSYYKIIPTPFSKREAIKVLDVGCGNGRLFEELENKNIKYFGIDYCEKLIDIARNRYKNSASRAQFAIFDIDNMPFGRNRFDTIFAVAVINHIPSKESQKKVLTKLYQILKPGGIFLMTNWNLWNFNSKKNVFNYNFKKWKMSDKKWKEKYGIDKKEFKFKNIITEWKTGEKSSPLYYYVFTKQEIDKLMKEVGFKILNSYYSKNGEKTGRFQGSNIITIAKK